MDPDLVSHKLTLRVPDRRATYDSLLWRAAEFLTPPVGYDCESRAFFRDRDGHLLEISQAK